MDTRNRRSRTAFQPSEDLQPAPPSYPRKSSAYNSKHPLLSNEHIIARSKSFNPKEPSQQASKSSSSIVNVRSVNDLKSKNHQRPLSQGLSRPSTVDVTSKEPTNQVKFNSKSEKFHTSLTLENERPSRTIRKHEAEALKNHCEGGDLETIDLTNDADRRVKGASKSASRTDSNSIDDYEQANHSESSLSSSGEGGGGDCSSNPSARRYISVESLVLEDNFDANFGRNKASSNDGNDAHGSEELPQVKVVWTTPPSASPRRPIQTLDLPVGNEADEKNVLDFFTKTQDGTEREGRHDDVEAVVGKFYTRTIDENGQVTKAINLQNVIDNLDEFVLQPAAIGFDVQCRVTRDRKGVDRGFYPTYYMHLERSDGRKVLLLTGRKRKKSTTSNYLISTDAADLSRDSNHFVGKVRSNLLGTQFVIYDNGESSKRFGSQSYGAKTTNAREELAAVIYEPNVLGFKGPRKMKILIPEMRNEAYRREHRPEIEKDSVLELQKQGDCQGFFELKNKAPIWNNDNQSFVLNFHGRVTQASVKNFQIIHEMKQDYVLLQFGRVASDLFTMDFRYPLCALQAFAIVLTSFDNKLACE